MHSFGDALGSLGTGALQGLAGGVGGAVAGRLGTMVAGKVGSGLMGRLATEAVENGVDDVINQAVTTGRVNPKSAMMGMIPGVDARDRPPVGPAKGTSRRRPVDCCCSWCAAWCCGRCAWGRRPVARASGSSRAVLISVKQIWTSLLLNEVVAEANTAGTKLAWTDLHNDIVGQFTPTGTALDASTVYDPLGKVIATAGAMVGSLGYQSEWTDNPTSRVNMMARWYNTDTGQFDTRDSASNSPAPASVTANRYQYGDANPLTVTDPSGHSGWGFVKHVAHAVTSTVTSTYHAVSSYTSSAYNSASESYHAATSYVRNTYHATVNKVSKAYHKVKKAVHHAYHAVKKRVHKYASAVKRHVKKAIAKVKKKVVKFAKAAYHKAAKVTKAAVKIAKQAGKAAVAGAKRVVKDPLGAVKDAAKATKQFVITHKDALIEIAAVGVGILAGMACTAITASAGAVACMIGASALVNLTKDALEGNVHSLGDALGSLGTGALQGLAGGVGGAGPASSARWWPARSARA